MKNKFTFHLLGLVHLPLTKTFNSCAFSQKNIKLIKMLLSLDHTVYYYGCRAKDEPPIEEYYKSKNFYFIETHTVDDIAKDYGEGNNLPECNGLGYAWRNVDYKHDLNSDRKPSTLKFYAKCIEHINKVKKPDDFLLATQGTYHKPVADAVGLFLTCEPGIGYRGSCPTMFRAFESAYGMNFTYGSEHPLASINGSYYDRVIPNYFDPADVEFSRKKGDYFLFIGRLIKRKGILTAYLATKAIGAKLIIVGQGGVVRPDGHLVDNHPQEFDIPPDSNWEYRGFADINTRKKLMARAQGVFVATEYLEMFGGTHVEAMLSGTPCITTNFGVFGGDTFVHGVHGFKCDTLDDFVYAAKNVDGLNPDTIVRNGRRFLMDNVKWQFQKWFEDLYQVYLSTDNKTPGWHHIREKVPQWRNMI